MNSPQLSLGTSLEVAASVHGQDVVANQHVALLPRVIICNTSVVQKAVYLAADGVRDLGCLAINCDVGGLETGLVFGPRLVIPQARLSSNGMVNDQRQAVQFGRLK